MSKYGVFSGPYFLAFGLNTERYSVSPRIQSECGKTRTRKNSVFGDFSRSFIVKLYDKSICKPLNIIFKSCLTQGIFPSKWKRANVSIRKQNKTKKRNKKKETKNFVLKTTDLPLFSRSLAKFLNKSFPYLIGKNLISENQSGFKPDGNSCANQFSAITHEIFSRLVIIAKLEVFLGISEDKVFDKM